MANYLAAWWTVEGLDGYTWQRAWWTVEGLDSCTWQRGGQ